jgi:hypothetical protein
MRRRTVPTIKIQGEEVEIEFYREDVTESKCSFEPEDKDLLCAKNSTHVNIDDEDDVICNKHRLEMSPGERRRYIKIEDVPFLNRPRSASEVAFNGADDDTDDEDFELSDEEAEAALVKGE